MANWVLGQQMYQSGCSFAEIGVALGVSLSTTKSECSRRFPRRTKPGLTQDQIVALGQDYLSGMSEKDMMQKYQVTAGTIQNHRRKNGWPVRYRPWTQERADEVVSLYQSGLSGLQIRKKLHVNHRYVVQSLQEAGVVSRGRGSPGDKNYFWKQGKSVDKHGYVLIKMSHHPHANKNGYVREHRLVMEEVLGRYLDPKEVVHHKNGIPDDNRPENLEMFSTNGEHLKHELTGRKRMKKEA